jgi:hypothetical protein
MNLPNAPVPSEGFLVTHFLTSATKRGRANSMLVYSASIILAGAAACGSSEASGPTPEPLSALQPACDDPAPLLGASDPRTPGYIVVFHTSVDAELETARLAAAHGFQPRYVWTASLEGFSGGLTREVVAELRCASTVDFIEHNQFSSVD